MVVHGSLPVSFEFMSRNLLIILERRWHKETVVLWRLTYMLGIDATVAFSFIEYNMPDLRHTILSEVLESVIPLVL